VSGPELFAGLPGPLGLLAEEMLMLGLGVEGRLSEGFALVKVWHPGLVVTGVSVCHEAGTAEGASWFRVCGGELLAPCDDVSGAAVQVHRTLNAVIAAYREGSR
jgi:hypothetical protein